MDISSGKWKKPIMEIVNNAPGPVGSWYIVNEFRLRGVDVSSATIGRELNQLEVLGYMLKDGFKGRVITQAGKAYLAAMNSNIELEFYKKSLDDLINSDILENFLMVLEARLAIERQTARLAAQRISDSELKELRSIVENQKKHAQGNVSIANDDIAFHSGIAKASQNKALFSLYMMLSSMGQQSELFEELRSRVGDFYSTYHQDIMEALEARDPDKAEEMMVRHIGKLTGDVDQYWDEYQKKHR
ncbi:MAG: FCD domain-containing protein [Sphaerochaetaceae bacterium]